MPQSAFVEEEVKEHISQSIEACLSNALYSHAKVSQWTSSVVESVLKKLTGLQKPFKYIVTAVIMEKTGAGLHTASSCYWDNQTDGSCTVRWDGKNMYAIVSVYGLSV